MPSVYFAGLRSDTNLGDIVIIESTERLYKDAFKGKGDFLFECLNLQFSGLNFWERVVRKLKREAFKLLNIDRTNFELNLLKNYYKKQLNNPGLIVLVGGGLIKYKYQNFFLYLTALIDVAEKKGIPLVINAAGVEGYNECDVRCQLLKKSLNKNIVRSITTRDDLETLKNKYIKKENQNHINKVADSAVYCNEVYQIKKKKSAVFGIGLVRGNIFLDNERDFGPEKVIDFYVNLIKEMEERELSFQLFTNGYSGDSELASDIAKKLGRQELNVIEPNKDEELVETISSFTTVIAARLHANIISYALDIPSIGLVWNDKLTLFGEDIGYPERFFEYDKLDASNIINAALVANKQGYEPTFRQSYRKTAKNNIQDIVNKWLLGKL